MKTLDMVEVRKVLSYDPLTGEFHRLVTHRSVKTGDVAGTRVESPQKPGKYYIRIGVLGSYVYGHRLAVAFITGTWPTEEVDHIDQNSENNRWDNLRICSKRENSKNLSPYRSNSSGYPGVTLRPNGKYRARIMIDGKSRSLGDWDSPEEAIAARKVVKNLEGFHANHC